MTSPTPTTLPDQVIAGIAQQLTEDYPGLTGATLTDVVKSVISKVAAAVQALGGGDPVGMVRRSADGDIATRAVDEGGFPVWRVSSADGTSHSDRSPTLPWDVIYTPVTEGQT